MNTKALEILNRSKLVLTLDQQAAFQRAFELIVKECQDVILFDERVNWLDAVQICKDINEEMDIK